MAEGQFETPSGRIALGRQIGKGGEGVVCEVEGRPGLLAKVYHTPPSTDRVDKLLAMLEVRSTELAAVAAWPTEILRAGGQVVGFTMSRAEGRELHVLYGPTSRRKEFPDADWRFLVRAASNLARAMGRIHKVGGVVGDLNPSGVMVSRRALVQLIDCDSFQIRSHGRLLSCDVGVPMYAPPELQGSSFRGVERTPNQDAFGLAVLIFHVLFLGRHPFAGRYLGSGEQPGLEEAIANFRFAYSAQAASRSMAPPPGMIGLEVLPAAVSALFERAFAPEGVEDDARPAPADWVAALGELEERLVRCTVRTSHLYADAEHGCPWCLLERRLRVDFFPVESRPAFDLDAVWHAIASVRPASDAGAPRSLEDLGAVAPSAEANLVLAERRSQLVRAVVGAGVVLAILIAATGPWWVVPGGAVLWALIGRSRPAPLVFVARAADARAEWTRRADAARARPEPAEFVQIRARLERARDELRKLQSTAADTRTRSEAAQRRAFLESQLLSNAYIDGIGGSLTATLLSHGIETAADVVRANMEQVPGFGRARIERLLAWRRSVEAKFVPTPTDGGKLDDEIGRLRVVLTSGPSKLSAILEQAAAGQKMLVAAADEALAAWAQAQADLRALESRMTGPWGPVVGIWLVATAIWLWRTW